MRATPWFGGEISRRNNEVIEIISVPKRKLCQVASHIIHVYFGDPLRYRATKPKRCSHLVWISLILVLRDRNLRIIGWGQFCNFVNILRSLGENTADTKDFRRQSTIPMISVPVLCHE